MSCSASSQLKLGTTTQGSTRRATAPSSSSSRSTLRSWSGGSLRSTRLSWCKVTRVHGLAYLCASSPPPCRARRKHVQLLCTTALSRSCLTWQVQSRKNESIPCGTVEVELQKLVLIYSCLYIVVTTICIELCWLGLQCCLSWLA